MEAKKQVAQSLTLQVTSFCIVHCEAIAVFFVRVNFSWIFSRGYGSNFCVFWLFQDKIQKGREGIKSGFIVREKNDLKFEKKYWETRH